MAIADPEKRFRMREAARRTAALYTWDATAEKTAALYEAILMEKFNRRL
jgi:glycosyltransferase involved in cell wall biosynthesis